MIKCECGNNTDDFVKFRYNGQVLEGVIAIVDSYGTKGRTIL